MKYIFKEKSNSKYQKGENPIDYMHISWYDMNKNNKCYDEDWFDPKIFKSHDFMTYIDTEDNEGDSDRTRVFVHLKNGDIYELCLHKLTKEQWSECSDFYGGRVI